ncbi:Arylsulfatase [Posidoniimonas polymericola]|uniref:Arylsulfatase n=2 Tax=Posidoniimonas polymericola TaxID=2528002 RepID=A0A5C5YR47_9BACT|nr:Arylsulfatase [Posidoniimonas polymericola]
MSVRRTIFQFVRVAARRSLPLTLGAIALSVPPLRCAAQPGAAAPNVIVVNIDDMGAGDFSVYGSQYSSTPNIDRLASEGTRFTNFYAGAPICSPSRAALFTGQYAARSGINSFLDNSTSNLNRDNANNLSLQAPSMAGAFQQAGYATGHFGKWHLGGGRDVGYADNPTPSTNLSAPRIVEYGYDVAWTQFEGLGNRIVNVVDYGGDAAGVSTRPSAYYNGLNQATDNLGTNGGQDQIVYLEREFNANFMVDRAIEFLGQSKQADPSKPVFMNVWLDEVHTPHDPPPALRAKYDALYPNLPAESRNYLAVLEATDAQVGKLIDYVDQQGLGNETLILVTADNGATGVNVNNIGSAGPSLRGSKGDLFEGGYREPLIARWTGNVAANRVDDQTVMWQTDLFPTLTAIAGVSPPPNAAFDGEDMSTALLGQATQARTTPLFWNMNRGTEDRHNNPDASGAGAGGQEVLAIRSGDWKLILNARGSSPELYNIAQDPGETTNLATAEASRTSGLAAQALAIRYSTPSRTLPDAVDAIVQLKAEDLAELGSGASVSSWSDAAGGDSFNGTVNQSNASAQPTVVIGALNGKAVVQFDGDDSLLSSTSNSLPSPEAGVTVFAVAKGDGSGDPAERLAQLGSSGGGGGQIVGLDASTSGTSTSNGGAGFRFNDGASLYDTPLDADDFHIVAWQVDPARTYSEATLFVDGTLPANTFSGSSTTPAGVAGFSGSDLELILGTGRSGGGGLLSTDNYTGQLAELLVFNEQLDLGQMNLVANYLSSEYGLPFAYQTNLDLFNVSGLAWVGGEADFGSFWNSGDGAGNPAASNTHPFATTGSDLYLGNGGAAIYDASTTLPGEPRINKMQIGTATSGLIVSNSAGNGTLVARDGVNLTIGSGSAPGADPETGDLTIGQDGFAGTLRWESTGTLNVEGRLRVGQGGDGVFEQTNGVVSAGHVAGSLKFLAIGNGAGSNGVYRLENGQLLPGGGANGPQLRHLRVGYAGATGLLEVGDGAGAAGPAFVGTRDDLYIGYDGGSGTLAIEADGEVLLAGNDAPVFIGLNAGSSGAVHQQGGRFRSDGRFSIGEGVGASGVYEISSGELITGADGAATVFVGSNGGSGAMRVSGDASVVHNGTVALADGATGTSGRLEFLGANASFRTRRLENAGQGATEALRWEADAEGVTALVVTGSGSADDVQLQSPSELAANTGANGGGDLRGDGSALELDLSALTGAHTLTLIDNLTGHAIAGYFEAAESGDLIEEGEQIIGTGYNGVVTLSYLGGDGNDAVLTLTSGLVGDYNSDGVVDAADYTLWRDNRSGGPNALVNRATGLEGAPIGTADLEAWRANYGQSLANSQGDSGAVPEPSAAWLILPAIVACSRSVRKS